LLVGFARILWNRHQIIVEKMRADDLDWSQSIMLAVEGDVATRQPTQRGAASLVQPFHSQSQIADSGDADRLDRRMIILQDGALIGSSAATSRSASEAYTLLADGASKIKWSAIRPYRQLRASMREQLQSRAAIS
jgi:hypothetical protein